MGLRVVGERVVEGTRGETKARGKAHMLESGVDQPQRAADLLKSETQHWRGALFGKRLHIITDSQVDAAIRENMQRLEAGGGRVLEGHEVRFLPGDVFISVVEKAHAHRKNRAAAAR